jgi:hypothetical protein
MDNAYRRGLEGEIEAHVGKIAELAHELRHVERLALHLGRVSPQLSRHMDLLRAALKGRAAAREIAADRLAQECLAMNSLMRG